jgi:hypothetical protein
MQDQVITVVMIVAIFIGLPVVILWSRDRITRAWRESPRARAARADERRRYEQRILKPDWARVENQLGRAVPQALRDLYENEALVTSRDLDYSIYHAISTFEALDAQAFGNAKKWLGVDGLVFATSDMGDSIYLRPGASAPDTVYLLRHDGGDTEVIAATIDEMVARLTH